MVEFYFHGFGSDAATFRAVWDARLAPGQGIFLEGPETDRLTGRRRWFTFSARPETLSKGIAGAAVGIERQIDAALETLPLAAATPITLIGHSQGAMICLDILRRRRFDVREVRCYSAYLPQALFTPASPASRRDAVLHIYSSTIDRYIPAEAVTSTVNYFERTQGVVVVRHQTTRLTHDFTPDWLNDANFEQTKVNHETRG